MQIQMLKMMLQIFYSRRSWMSPMVSCGTEPLFKPILYRDALAVSFRLLQLLDSRSYRLETAVVWTGEDLVYRRLEGEDMIAKLIGLSFAVGCEGRIGGDASWCWDSGEVLDRVWVY